MFDKYLRVNKFKSYALILVFVVLLGLTLSAGAVVLNLPPVFFLVILVIVAVSPWVLYFKSSEIVVKSTKAVEPTELQGRVLNNVLQEVCLASGLPLPKIFVVHDPSPNAFVTGHNPESAVVVVTSGLLEKMNRDQLQAVLAHEMSHVLNKDMLVATLAASVAGSIIVLSNFALRMSLFSRRSTGSHPVILVVSLLGLIIAPLGAMLLRSAVSRKREQLADYSAAKLIRNPKAMREALEVLYQDSTPLRNVSLSTSHLWIEDPNPNGSGSVGFFHRIFATHPPLPDRIQAMKDLESKGL